MDHDADLTDLAEELRTAVGDFVRRVRAYDTMPRSQVAVLGHLARTGPLSIADLARRERVKHQSMTRTINLLNDQGLVSLGAAEDDRRRVVVTLNGTGTRRLTEERRQRSARIAAALQTLDGEERALIARLPAVLDKLVD
ncbi:MarR family winged helix-turn-helix transcriptional regulator [Actinoplanes sp. NPDC049681]|uniref:MarR family winged helix-turn-helix transcriptional regulator n=1 Tax=Actinoplanes sp. NPDC049681 TaxID=3363905 RepID=UPI0037A57CC6